MLPAPKRCWFRFSLRTLFVVVTMVAITVSYLVLQLNWLRQRREFHTDLKLCVAGEVRPNTRAPGLLWLFGDYSYSKISLNTHSKLPPATEGDLATARRLFPEAEVGCKLISWPGQDDDFETVYRWRQSPLPP